MSDRSGLYAKYKVTKDGARKRFAYCHCGAVMDGAEDHA